MYNRIYLLEGRDTHLNLPQEGPGEYLRFVRKQLEEASHTGKAAYEALLDSEILDLALREKKQEAQDVILDLLHREPLPRFRRILEVVPNENLQEEAFDFIQGQTAPWNEVSPYIVRKDYSEFAHVSFLVTDMRLLGHKSETYQSFLQGLGNPPF